MADIDPDVLPYMVPGQKWYGIKGNDNNKHNMTLLQTIPDLQETSKPTLYAFQWRRFINALYPDGVRNMPSDVRPGDIFEQMGDKKALVDRVYPWVGVSKSEEDFETLISILNKLVASKSTADLQGKLDGFAKLKSWKYPDPAVVNVQSTERGTRDTLAGQASMPVSPKTVAAPMSPVSQSDVEQSVIRATSGALLEIEIEIADLKKQIEARDQTCDILSQTIAQHEANLDDAKTENGRLAGELHAAEQSSKEARTEVKKLRLKMEKQEGDLDKQNSELAKMRKKLEYAKGFNDLNAHSLKEELAQKILGIDKRDTELAQMTAELKQKDLKLVQKGTALEKSKADLDRLRAKVRDWEVKTADEDSEDGQDKTQDLQSLQQHTRDQDTELARLRQQLQQIKLEASSKGSEDATTEEEEKKPKKREKQNQPSTPKSTSSRPSTTASAKQSSPHPASSLFHTLNARSPGTPASSSGRMSIGNLRVLPVQKTKGGQTKKKKSEQLESSSDEEV